MVLLHALAQLAEKDGWKISVAHFNHQLRGRSSHADEALVRKTAAALALPFAAGRADVGRFARASKLSLEMAARQLRHEFFARVAQARQISTVALAHHADDQMELFFLRLLRGAGGEGLAGMKWRAPSPVMAKKIFLIRPLLDLDKAQLRQFARENQIPFREDASNGTCEVPRNRIRHELLPLLRKNYQPGLAKTVLRLMEIVGAEAELVGALAEKWRRQRRPAFAKLPAAVQRRVLQAQLVALKIAPDFERIEALRSSTRGVPLALHQAVARNAAGIVSRQKKMAVPRFRNGKQIVEAADGAGEARLDGVVFKWRISNAKKKLPPRRPGREFFDADKVGGRIFLRHWQAGDRFRPSGLTSAAKLQDLFVNAKIPQTKRHVLILATTGAGEIFWVEGLRISENFKLTPQTKRRLVWRWRRPQSV